MGKNRKRLKGPGAAQAPGPRPQHGMRPTAPPQPRPPPLFGGFRGPAPIRPMGPGQRFPAPHRAFGPRPPRLMRFMDSMDGDRGLMHEPQGSMMDDEPYHSKNIPDRHDIPSLFDAPDPHFHHHQEFGNGPPAPRFHRPEPEYAPRFHSPEFDDKPQMDGNRMFGDRGGFAGPPPPDFRGPGQVQPPTQAFNATSMAPLVKDCPPQPLKKKDQIDKSMAAKMSTFKNISANAPRGRSLGVISFIGNNCGFIEREDLKKFSFTFDAFFGNRAHLMPGVKVHFTAVKNLGKDCAVDMKVAPGGTEDIDTTLYEGVVISTLPDDNVKEANPGCIRTFISTNQIEVPFGKADTSVTLLLYDLVEFQLLTNVITKEQRATNIKPKTPDTFDLTKEIRKMGVVMKKSDGTLTIMTEKHDNLVASATDKLSDDELNVMDKVELTVLTVNDTKKAVRLKKLPEGSVNFNQKAKGNENISGAKDRTSGTTPGKDKWKPVTMKAGSQDSVSFDTSSEKYEGMIIKIVPKKSPSKEKVMDNQEPSLGFLVTTVEGTEKQLSFRSGNVITKATMMVGDKVQFNIFTNSVTKEEYADNIEILPETFQTDSEEQRKLGLVVKLGDNFGYIKTPQDPQIFFDISEVMEDTKLTLSEKVEFTLVPSQAAEGGKQAVRIRRLNESVFTSAPKLEAFGVKEKKKMTIKLLNHPKDQIKDVVETEDNGSESMDVEYNWYRSQSQDRSRSYYRSSSHERSDDQYRYSWGWSEEHEERYSQSHSRSPVEEELLRKRRELMELNELIARKKAIVAMEQNAKEIEPEDGKSVTTFDYQHVHHENIWMPDLKPVKSILKKQSEPHTDSQSQASTSRENAAFFVESQKMQKGYPQQTGDFGSDYSTFESTTERTLTTAGSEKTSLNEIQDPELVRKRKQLEDLSEFIVRKKAMFAMEQKVRAVREMEAECEFDSHTENQFVMSKGNSWSSEIKPDFQPKKSILKRHSEIPTSQIDTTSVDEYGQPNQDDSFTKPSSKTAAFPFINRSSNPEPIHPVTLGLFNRIMNESSAASQKTETPPFNKPIIPQSLMQASSSRSLHDQKSSNISQEDQQGASSCLPHDHSPSSKPSTSQTSPSDPKRNLTTQMERFLSALNKADTSVVNSLFQEARKDLALMNTEKPTQPQLDRNTPFRDELYDPFKEDEDNDRPMVSENWSESSEDKVRKSENFEKIQSLLQTIGLQLDTAEVSKLADRTQERLYGKMRKPHSASSHSFEKKRERLGSQTEQRGSSRAHSSDSESFRSVSPAQSSSRKVYMSYEDAVKYKDQHKVEDVDLTSIKRTVVNLKPATDDKDPDEPELTAVSQASYQPVTTGTTVQPNYYQYAQNYSISAFSASQYSQYQSSGQHVWGSMVPGLYPYSTVPSSPYAIGHQAMAPHMMPAYSWYTAQMANPYCVLPPLSMPPPYVPPPTSNPLHSTMPSADTNQVASENPPESITATTTTPLRCLTKIKMVQTGPVIITEDQIKRRQKERLERFNQKMKLKNEQQMEAQRSRGQNPNSAPGKSTPNEIKNVWIFGHSLVFWAEKRATSPEYGVQLGMHPDSVRIWWKGVQGMTWQQLIPSLLQRKDKWPEPDVLIIHLGGNDISTTDPEAFVETVKKDLSSLKTIFPKCLFVWSSILSRQSWRGTEDSKGMNIIRMAVNETICKMMKELGGFSLIHKNIRLDGGVYRPDGIHLSGKGIDVFNLNLQAFLERWERKTNKTETSDPSV